jgi:K+-sensing histidine kinase KdpD
MIDQHRDGINAIVINLARRSQLLVEQQLRLLDDMEREERDPAKLAALFRLDHLATRMRRNDENLLVLVGGQARRRPTANAVLDGVVLAASAEIEQYHRVHANLSHLPMIVGHAVPDLVHLLAELLENATTFSPPDAPVRVLSRMDDDEVLAVDVIDEGIGLSPGGLADANALLAEPPDLTLDTSERMGLMVVSHLAARHLVRVRLASSPAGTCATVRFPGDLLAPRAAGEADQMPGREAGQSPGQRNEGAR